MHIHIFLPSLCKVNNFFSVSFFLLDSFCMPSKAKRFCVFIHVTSAYTQSAKKRRIAFDFFRMKKREEKTDVENCISNEKRAEEKKSTLYGLRADDDDDDD